MSGMSPIRLVLTREEKASSLWKRIDEHLRHRLQALRVRNDQMMPEPERCKQLGQIHEVKQLLSVADEQPVSSLEISRPG